MTRGLGWLVLAGLVCGACQLELGSVVEVMDSATGADSDAATGTDSGSLDETDGSTDETDGTEDNGDSGDDGNGCVPVETDSPDTETVDSETVDTGMGDTEIPDSETVDTGMGDTEIPDSETGDTGTGDTGTGCPVDMVRMPAAPAAGISADFCMDRYEASRSNATATWGGNDPSIAESKPGVLPWYVNPMTSSALATFEAACQAAGKRLCGAAEWESACRGPQQTTYFFGNTWDPAVCNSVDTYCQACCDILGLQSCPTTENCGYSSLLSSSPYTPETCFVTEPYHAETCHVCFHVMPTGAFSDCERDGLFDVNGNVWEVVPVPTSVDSRGFQIRGGAFNCGAPSQRFQCTFNANWTGLYAGFRCCRELPGG